MRTHDCNWYLISNCFNRLSHTSIISKIFVKRSYFWLSLVLACLVLRSLWPTRLAWAPVHSWQLQFSMFLMSTYYLARCSSCISNASTSYQSKSRCGSDTKDWKKGPCLLKQFEIKYQLQSGVLTPDDWKRNMKKNFA